MTPTDPCGHDWREWSCACRVVVTDPAALDEALAATRSVMAGVELACSRFRPDSELFTLRPDPGGWLHPGPIYLAVLRAALWAAAHTDGAVDPTIGGTLADLGYDRDLASLPGDRPCVVVRRPPGWRSLELDGDRLRMPAGTELDLGAVAKAWAADRAAELAAERTGAGVLVSLGGDIATAGPAKHGWQVRVQDLAHDLPQQVTLSSGGAIATSSTARRSWRRGGVAAHHLVDPRTARPASGPWRSLSVVAGSCVAANTVSTAALVLGTDGPTWLREQAVPARAVTHEGAVWTQGGWPDAEVAA